MASSSSSSSLHHVLLLFISLVLLRSSTVQVSAENQHLEAVKGVIYPPPLTKPQPPTPVQPKPITKPNPPTLPTPTTKPNPPTLPTPTTKPNPPTLPPTKPYTPVPKPPVVAPTPPVVTPPTPYRPPVKKEDCGGLCLGRCKLHSRPALCLRACSTCCVRCKCVPPGTYGNRELCGKCYTEMRTHGNRYKCP